MEQYLTLEDVAESVKLCKKTIERYASSKKITGFKLAGKWRFRAKDVEKWVASNG